MPAYWQKVGTNDWRSVTTGQGAWTVTAGTVGDLRVIHTLLCDPTITITGMSGGGCANWMLAGSSRTITAFDSTFGFHVSTSLWFGKVTDTGTSLTVTYSSAIGSVSVRQYKRDFRSLRNPGMIDNYSATQQSFAEQAATTNDIAWSSLTSTGPQLVVGDSGAIVTVSSGTGANFSFESDPFVNPHCHNLVATAGNAHAPGYITTASGDWYALLTIFDDGYYPPVTVQQNAINRASRW